MNLSNGTLIGVLSILALLPAAAGADCVSGNCQNGFGKFVYGDSGVYEGGFKDARRHGQGTYTWPNKVRYVGNWKIGDQSGQGSAYASDGDVLFSGTWNHGQEVTMASRSTGDTGLTNCAVLEECQGG